MVKYTDEQILELLQRDFAGRRVLLLAPVVKDVRTLPGVIREFTEEWFYFGTGRWRVAGK